MSFCNAFTRLWQKYYWYFQVWMATFLVGVSGLTAAWPVVVEFSREPEPVLTPLPRGREKTVKAPFRRPGLAMTSPVQKVTIQLRSVHTTPGEFENWRNNLCLRKVLSGRDLITFFPWSHCVKRFRFQIFSVHTTTQSRCFKFLRFQERFRKAPFWWRTGKNDGPNRRNKAAFSNSSHLV